jgi:hypothetical protein
MNALILDETERGQIEGLNAGGDGCRALHPVALVDGRFALNADLLADCGPGQTWEHYGELLAGLNVEEIGVGQVQHAAQIGE